MRRLVLLLLALAIPALCLAEGERHLAAPPLSATARALVHQKMLRHSKDMTELVWAVVLLDYGVAANLARSIAAEPRLGRPTSGDATELNSALPPRFFQLQDQLRTRAHELETAARTRDAAATARSYGALAATCVSCHDVYLGNR